MFINRLNDSSDGARDGARIYDDCFKDCLCFHIQKKRRKIIEISCKNKKMQILISKSLITTKKFYVDIFVQFSVTQIRKKKKIYN